MGGTSRLHGLDKQATEIGKTDHMDGISRSHGWDKQSTRMR